MTPEQLFDETYDYLSKHVVYQNENAHVAHTLWIAGSYFLEYALEVPVFFNFPIIYFTSPEEGHGKSRALDVTEILAYNAINGGSYTAPAVCREIDDQAKVGKLITVILDELDETLKEHTDNSAFIRLLNNGYQWGKYIGRASLNNEDKNKKTMAYAAYAIAGLTLTCIKPATRSRIIPIRMRPQKKEENANRRIDFTGGKELNEKLLACRSAIVDQLKTMDESTLSELFNRPAQLMNPLLALAKIAGEKWFKRASEATMYFVYKQKSEAEEKPGRIIFTELYKSYLADRTSSKGIFGEELAKLICDKELLGFTDKGTVREHLKAYGISTSQFRKGDKVNMGYAWEDCIEAFSDYILEEDRDRLYNEVHKRTDSVEVVEKSGPAEIARDAAW